MSKNKEYKQDHEMVRELLEKMQTFGGAAIKPFALYPIFYEILQEQKPSIMNKAKVRDIVDTYCALCNEFFVLNHFAKEPRTDFFMSNERWSKYFLGQKAKENSLKFLNGWAIHYVKKQNPCKPINTVRMYRIDLETLYNFVRLAEQQHEKAKYNKK